MLKPSGLLRTGVTLGALLSGVLATSACDGAQASLPATKTVTAAHALAFESTAHDVTRALQAAGGSKALAQPADLGTILTGARELSASAERTAAELPALRRAITLCALALFAVGIVNAVLLMGILLELQRMRGMSVVTQAIPSENAADAQARACGCGEPIAVRSRSGRCRSCARRGRIAQAAA